MLDAEDSQVVTKRGEHPTLLSQFLILATLLALMWTIEIIDVFTVFFSFDRYGIVPRTSVGIRNIFFAPFLHAGFGHLLANSAPFAVLGWFVMLRRTSDFWWVSLISVLVGGGTVWTFAASNTIHLGASALVFGYLGYLLLRGFFERSLQASSLALLVLFLYGSMIWGVLPLQPGVSWLGHLGGFIGGGLAGYLLADR